MKVHLLYPDRDFDLMRELPWNENGLTQDLEIGVLLSAMCGDDKYSRYVSGKVIFAGLGEDASTILYRQEIVRDCIKNPAVIRELFELAGEAVLGERKIWWLGISKFPGAILSESLSLLQLYTGILRRLRELARRNEGKFESAGITRFFKMLQAELGEDYLGMVERHLAELRFPQGVLLTAQLGDIGEGTNYVLRESRFRKLTWFEKILNKGPEAYTYVLAPRDETGARILGELRDRGINHVANALAQSGEHIRSFFQALQAELAFYVGGLNLHDRLVAKKVPVCFPIPEPRGQHRHEFSDLRDVSLALTMDRPTVGNALNAEQVSLTVISGANQGGKSSFLRGIGLAQLMMQCGLFVAAERFRADLCSGLFTHYRRKEDDMMKRGKFDEELARMSEIVDHLTPNSLLLFNESFAATNEREGSEIARQIISALLGKGMKIYFVTHLYEFSRCFFDQKRSDARFLRAERRTDGTRTFKIVESPPLETSFGEDLYRSVFSVVA